jgi:hypothetical protein
VAKRYPQVGLLLFNQFSASIMIGRICRHEDDKVISIADGHEDRRAASAVRRSMMAGAPNNRRRIGQRLRGPTPSGTRGSRSWPDEAFVPLVDDAATLLSRGESIPPCGVPLSVRVNCASDSTPAFRNATINRLSLPSPNAGVRSPRVGGLR